MGTDFVLQVKCTIFWLNIRLRVYLDLHVPDFPKSNSKYFFFILALFSLKHPILEAFLLKTPKSCKKQFGPKKVENIVKNKFVIWVWKSFNSWAAQNNYLKKKHCIQKLYIAVKHLDPCFLTTFCKKQVLRGTFGEIWRIQIQIYPKTYVGLKYGACNLQTKSVPID